MLQGRQWAEGHRTKKFVLKGESNLSQARSQCNAGSHDSQRLAIHSHIAIYSRLARSPEIRHLSVPRVRL
jgi:hypothetical protein